MLWRHFPLKVKFQKRKNVDLCLQSHLRPTLLDCNFLFLFNVKTACCRRGVEPEKRSRRRRKNVDLQHDSPLSCSNHSYPQPYLLLTRSPCSKTFRSSAPAPAAVAVPTIDPQLVAKNEELRQVGTRNVMVYSGILITQIRGQMDRYSRRWSRGVKMDVLHASFIIHPRDPT